MSIRTYFLWTGGALLAIMFVVAITATPPSLSNSNSTTPHAVSGKGTSSATHIASPETVTDAGIRGNPTGQPTSAQTASDDIPSDPPMREGAFAVVGIAMIGVIIWRIKRGKGFYFQQWMLG